MFEELDIVELTHNISKKRSLKAGERGTVVGAYNNGSAYEVEFVNPNGSTKALLTLMPKDIRRVLEKEINYSFDVSFSSSLLDKLINKTKDCDYCKLRTEAKTSRENTEYCYAY